MKLPPHSNSPFVIGVRGGYSHCNVRWPYDYQDYTYRNYGPGATNYSFHYINPCISIESRYFGVGGGWVGGFVPASFHDHAADSMGHVSGHLRIGSMRGANFSFSVMENSPYASGGGTYDLVVSVPLSRKVRSAFGFSAGPYYGIGFLQQNRIMVNDHLGIDINWRAGSIVPEGSSSLDVTEYGISAGVVYQISSRARQ